MTGLSILLERIQKGKRRGEKAIWAEFDRIRPALLGYIMDVLVKILQRWDSVKLAEYPRMADFARFGELAARCMDYPESAFLTAYNENIDRHTKEAIDASPVASAIIKLMADRGSFEGTVSELLAVLEPIAAEVKCNTKDRRWPSSPQSLGRRLNEIKTDLREIGRVIERPEDKKTNVSRVIIGMSEDSADTADRPPHDAMRTEQIQPEKQLITAEAIPCPYCRSHFTTPSDALKHSLNIHPKKPFVSDMARLGYNLRFD